jgi:diguanylate cyclase (GGDEF)-like protein
VRRADGTYRFTRSLQEVVHDASGRLVYVLAFVTDETYLRRQARLLRSLVSAMPLGLNVMELKEGELVPSMTSPAAIQWSGLTMAQNMGQEPIPEGFHAVFDNGEVFASATGQVRVRQFLSRQLKTGLPAGVRHLTVRRADGQVYFADYWFIPIHGPDGSMEYLLSVAVDQTHHKALQQVAERANAELREANQRLKVIVENLPGGVAAFDAEGRLLLANQSLGVYLDLPSHMLEHERGHFDDMVRYRAQQGEYGPVDIEALVRERHALLALTEPFVAESTRANGRVLELRTAPLPGGGMVTTYTDVTERKAAEDQIRQLAFYDVLTRLPNRRLLLDRLERAIEFSIRHANFGAVLFLDLDQFKSINDTRGHDAGDELLVAVAQRLQASVRDADTVARLGGDEFVVLLSALGDDPRTAAEAAHRVAGKLNQSLAAPYAIQGDLYPCTSSIGVTVFGREGDTVATILKQADIALYQAKDGGRNTVRFFDQAMQASVQTRVHMEAGLRRALLNSEFHLEYQPQLNTDGSVRGAEVLLRWVAPDGRSISPAQFIPTAEDTALIIPIGLWVFEEVCWRVAGWQHQPGMARLVVSVNVSARQLREPDFVPAMASILHRTGVAPQRLMLELTESIVIQDLRDVVAKLDALKALGLGLSMDDFGTGYSSLSQLQRLPLDELKIDQSFVRDIETDPGDAAIARAVIAMALALDMEVVAEGVETPGQHAFLAEQGCSAYQGYWFSRPLIASRFEQWVLERTGQPGS